MPSESENIRYKRLFETACDGILILDYETGKIIDVNPYLIELLGYAKNELLGKELWEIGAMVDKNASVKAFAILKKEGYIKYSDLPLLTKNGALISVEFVSNSYGVNGDRVIQCNIRDITSRKNAEAELLRFQQIYVDNLLQIVDALTKVIVARDPYTYQHQIRVSQLAVAIASEMGLSSFQMEGLRLAALIHDIGKISVPVEILTKPTQLIPAEKVLLHDHVKAGYDIIKQINFQWPIAEIVYQHHERLNGSGYPRKLSAQEICLEAKILAVSDTVEAMSHARPYREALGIDAALREIEVGKDVLYDANVVEACVKLFKVNGYKFTSID